MQHIRELHPSVASEDHRFQCPFTCQSSIKSFRMMTGLLQHCEEEHSADLGINNELYNTLRVWRYYEIS